MYSLSFQGATLTKPCLSTYVHDSSNLPSPFAASRKNKLALPICTALPASLLWPLEPYLGLLIKDFLVFIIKKSPHINLRRLNTTIIYEFLHQPFFLDFHEYLPFFAACFLIIYLKSPRSKVLRNYVHS
jgi:hypothetical protein